MCFCLNLFVIVILSVDKNKKTILKFVVVVLSGFFLC